MNEPRVINGVAYLTIRDIVERGIASDSTVRRRLKKKKVSAYVGMNGKILIKETDIEKLIRIHTEEVEEEPFAY